MREFFDKLVHKLPTAYIICDIQGIIKTPNVSACRMFKKSEDELK